jgi:hypothetical protein
MAPFASRKDGETLQDFAERDDTQVQPFIIGIVEPLLHLRIGLWPGQFRRVRKRFRECTRSLTLAAL